jgi:hypothetical protein
MYEMEGTVAPLQAVAVPWHVVRKLSGLTYVVSSGATGAEWGGVIVGAASLAVAMVSLAGWIAAGNRSARRNAAADERARAKDLQDAFDRGWKMRGEILGHEDER